MIKNLIILFLIYIIGVLLFASSSNVDLLKQKAVEAKEFIWGMGWFETQEEESYPKEENKVSPRDAPTPLPSPLSFLLPEEIVEETFSEKPKKE